MQANASDNVSVSEEDVRGGNELAPYLQLMKRFPPLVGEEAFNELFYRYRAGDQSARDRIVYGNIGLVIKMSWEYCRKGVPQADIVQEGLISLFEIALPGFEPAKSRRFSTYAVWPIRTAMRRITRAQHSGRPFHVSAYIIQRQRAVFKVRELFRMLNGRTPDEVELSQALRSAGKSVAYLKELLCSSPGYSSLSLAAPFYEYGDNLTLGDTLPATEEDPEQRVLHKEEDSRYRQLLVAVDQRLARFNKRERTVLSHRFGLDGDEPQSLQLVSERLNLSRTRIGQIEKEAIQQLAQHLKRTPQHIREVLAALGGLASIKSRSN